MRHIAALAVTGWLVGSGGAVAGELRGVEVDDLDRSVDPCTDFYEFANGTWRSEHPIPASMTRWSRRWEAGETAKEQLRSILDEVSARSDWPAGSVEQQVGDFYAACMDAGQADRIGLEPVRPLLARIESIEDVAGVEAMIGGLHQLAIDVPFGVYAASDNHEPTRMIADVYASGLGMPDRDYYLGDADRFREARDQYREHVATLFRLAGDEAKAADAAADTVLAFETRLAEASLDRVALRDPQATDHKTRFDELEHLAPGFDWDGYFGVLGLPREDLNVQEPAFLERFSRLLADSPVASWKTYLRWHVLHSAAPELSAAFVEADFDFYGRHLRGTREMKPRWKRCAESTDELLGEALGRKYVERYFPPEAKQRMQELVKNLLLAMGDTIRGLEWMGDETKAAALEKLATFDPKIGYPDRWKDYSSVEVGRDSHWANVVAGRRFLVADDLGQVGHPADRGRWGMTPPTSNAYYNPLLNEIVFPAGILQPPAFSLDASDAVNYGAIGVVIGHEISHGFDDQGAQYDAQGRLRNWWTDADLEKFQARGRCVVDQFEGYFVEPGLHHNGKLVLGESIGDLAGARIALRALHLAMAGEPGETIDGFTPEQQFFVSWGQFRGDAIRPETQRLMIQSDPHPVAKYRVIGPLSNLPEFRTAFSCSAEAPMVRPEAERCDVW